MKPLTLFCFAVKEEAKFFTPPPAAQVLLTGIGQANAEKAIRSALADARPSLVLSCGFAGGLRPDLGAGTVVFDAGDNVPLTAALREAGAQPVRFHCVQRVATTAAEKQALRQTTGADAVEMESRFIRAVCSQQAVPGATVRVILDTSSEDLPLDFNQLLTPELELDGRKLALAIMKAPGKIGALRRLQKQSETAARKLADVLAAAVRNASSQ